MVSKSAREAQAAQGGGRLFTEQGLCGDGVAPSWFHGQGWVKSLVRSRSASRSADLKLLAPVFSELHEVFRPFFGVDIFERTKDKFYDVIVLFRTAWVHFGRVARSDPWPAVVCRRLVRRWTKLWVTCDNGTKRRCSTLVPSSSLGVSEERQIQNDVVGRSAAHLCERSGALRRSRDLVGRRHLQDRKSRRNHCPSRSVALAGDLPTRTTAQPGRGGFAQECCSREGAWLCVPTPVCDREHSDGTELACVALDHHDV